MVALLAVQWGDSMKVHRCKERPNWIDLAKSQGLIFWENYWDESKFYSFTHDEIEKIIHPGIQSLHDICLELVDKAVDSEEMLSQLCIPEWFWPRLRDSWKNRSETLLGRFDLVYDGNTAPKMLEYNADTPSMLYETGFFQLQWLEQAIELGIVPPQSTQYNTVQDEMVSFFQTLKTDNKPIYFACVKEPQEDLVNLEYIINCANHAGQTCHQIFMEDVLISEDEQLLSPDRNKIDVMFRYYPWEFMISEESGYLIPGMKTKFIEPEWKFILTSKGILPMLWKSYRGHPNLLPSYFSNEAEKPDLSKSYVEKPIYSREGLNITIIEDGKETFKGQGPYGGDGYIAQEYCKIPEFAGRFPILGGWVINNKACGIDIREDPTRITVMDSFFAPHIVVD